MLRNESDPAASVYAASLSMRKQSLVWAWQFAAETNQADRRLELDLASLGSYYWT